MASDAKKPQPPDDWEDVEQDTLPDDWEDVAPTSGDALDAAPSAPMPEPSEVTPATQVVPPKPVGPEPRYPIPAPGRPLLMALGGKEMADALTFTPSAIPAAVRGVNNQFTRGMSDEIMGRVGAAFPRLTLSSVSDVFNPSVPTPPQRSYESIRDEMRGLEAKSADEHPAAYYGAPLALAAVTGNASAAQGNGGALARLWNSGAVQGGLSGFGNSNADLTGPNSGAADYVNAGLNTLGGAAIGKTLESTLPLAAEKIPGLAGKLSTWLGGKAEERALKAVTGRNQRLWEQLIPDDRFREIGRDILDNDVIPPIDIRHPLGRPSAEIRQRAAAVAEREGKAIGDTLKEIDALVPEEQMPWKYDIAQEIEARMVKPRQAMTAGDVGVSRRLQAEADQIRSDTFPTRPTLTRLEQQKRGLDQFIDHEAGKMKPMQDGLDDLRDYLANNVEQSAWKAAEDAGSDAAQRFVESKRLFGNMSAIAAPSIKQTARELSNRMMSPSDHGVGATAAIMSGQAGETPVASSLKGMLAAVANKVGRERGNQVAARGLDAASQSDLLWKAIQGNPTAFGDAAERLTNAYSQGPAAFALQDYMLAQTSPGYAETRRRALMEANGEQP